MTEIPALDGAVGGTTGLRRLLGRCEDASVSWRGRQVHIELIDVGRGLPTVVFHHGYGAYSRLYVPFFGLLADAGYNVVGIDRPGHGLSDGRRGDCTVIEAVEVTHEVLGSLVRPRFGGLVVLMGSSAGGMIASCMLAYLDSELDGAVCHNVFDPRWAASGWPGRLLQAAADAVPGARMSHRLLPARLRTGISSHPVVREWFSGGADPLASLDQTWRSVLSMTLSYRPPKPTSAVAIPVLVVHGSNDAMVPPARTRAAVDRLQLPSVTQVVVDGGHMLLHEAPLETLTTLTSWLAGHL